MGDLGERSAAPAHGRYEDDEVVNRAAEHDPEQDPDVAGQEPELRGQDRPNERPGAGDGREVVAEQHPAVGGVEIVAVLQRVGRRNPPVVEDQALGRDEGRVVAVGDREHRQGHQHEPNSVHGQASMPALEAWSKGMLS